MLEEFIHDNYGFLVNNVELIDEHFGTKIYVVDSGSKRYILKGLPSQAENMENEGHITQFLLNNGIKVSKIIKANNDNFAVCGDGLNYHLQDFIEGRIMRISAAPDWFLKSSAQLLGRIHKVLTNYKKMDISFGADFFSVASIENITRYYCEKLKHAEKAKDDNLSNDYSERLQHLRRLTDFDIITEKLTYTNSHGDYYFGQIIEKDRDLTVIDWTSACRLPVCMEVIMSYAYASPACAQGSIDIEGLSEYINNYSEYFRLNKYDYKCMPYILYFYLCICNYEPPYINIPSGYNEIFKLSQSIMNWLYDNADELSGKLCALYDK